MPLAKMMMEPNAATRIGTWIRERILRMLKRVGRLYGPRYPLAETDKATTSKDGRRVAFVSIGASGRRKLELVVGVGLM